MYKYILFALLALSLQAHADDMRVKMTPVLPDIQVLLFHELQGKPGLPMCAALDDPHGTITIKGIGRLEDPPAEVISRVNLDKNNQRTVEPVSRCRFERWPRDPWGNLSPQTAAGEWTSIIVLLGVTITTDSEADVWFNSQGVDGGTNSSRYHVKLVDGKWIIVSKHSGEIWGR